MTVPAVPSPFDAECTWVPPADAWSTTRIGQFAARHAPDTVGDHAALWQWSVDDLDGFWAAVWDEVAVIAHQPPTAVLDDVRMPGARWFPGATLNYAEHMLRGNGLRADDIAVVAESQSRGPTSLTLADLRDEVRRCADGLRRLGVGPGDRVVAYLPNIPETLVAFLATASLGAVWSSCAPEFGARSVVDRWGQVEPTVLLAVDGYMHGDRAVDRTGEVAAIRAGLPSLAHTVHLPHLDAGAAPPPGASTWDDLLAPTDAALSFVPVPFDHPLYVLFSSGTTGLPKAIVHGHGGILLEHAKVLALHLDLGPGDRFFWFSTTGWMMWNLLVSGLLVGSTVVLFDGNPGHPDLDTLWSLAARTETSVLGLSAPFLTACRRAGLRPAADHDLTGVRIVGSTGAPLPADGYRWVRDEVGAHVQVASISGGTDVCTAFVGSSPVLPVHAGVIPTRLLGCRVEAWDDTATSVVGATGELVLAAPMPSMPVGFWGDDDGTRYRGAYFDVFPGVWRHGDWITIAEDGSCVISGRSDATLNRGGVRLGSAEFYAVVDSFDEVVDSLVIHLEDADGGLGDLLLFVALRPGVDLDEDLRARLVGRLRSELSPRHGPDAVLAVPAVPRTLSGKRVEVPVKRILRGTPVAEAVAAGALTDPSALDALVAVALARQATTR